MAQAWENSQIQALGAKYNQQKAAGATKEELDAIHAEAQKLRNVAGYTTNDFGKSFTAIAPAQISKAPQSQEPNYSALLSIQQQFKQPTDLSGQINQNYSGIQNMLEGRTQQALSQYNTPATDNSLGIKNMYSQQQEANLQAIRQAVENAKNPMQQQLSALPQQYVPLKNQVDVGVEQQRRLTNEMLANQGQRGGENVTANVALGTTRENALNDLRMQEQNATNQIQNSINMLIQNGQFEEAKAIANNAAELTKSLVEEQNRIDSINRQNSQTQLTAQLGLINQLSGLMQNQNQDLMANTVRIDDTTNALKQQQIQNAMNEAGLTGTYQGQATLPMLQFNYGKQRDTIADTGILPNGQQTLYAQNQTFNQNMAASQQASAEKQLALDNLYRQQTFDYQKSRDIVSDSQWQKAMGLDLRRQSFNEAQQKIENALNRRQITQQERNQALQWAEYNAAQDPMSLDNQIKSANLNRINAETNNLNNGFTASGGIPSGQSYDYKTDPDFAVNISAINQNPETALKDIQTNAEQLVADYGWDGYKALLDYATSLYWK